MFSLSFSDEINTEKLEDIKKKGYSRIPIYYKSKNSFIMGVLITKSLLGVDLSHPKTLRQLFLEKKCNIRLPLFVSSQNSLREILNQFKQGNSHMAIVCDDPEQFTMETGDAFKMIEAGH